jgi:hypothetical protein
VNELMEILTVSFDIGYLIAVIAAWVLVFLKVREL